MYSIFDAVAQATLVSKCVLAILLFMSVFSWACIGKKWRTLRASFQHNQQAIERFDQAEKLEDALKVLQRDGKTALHYIAAMGVHESERVVRSGCVERLLNDNVSRALRRGTAAEMSRLSSSIALLATIANTATFIGLFGTVWGIMHSFQAIGSMDSVSLSTVAPGIAEALIATSVGLFVAIPATFGYNMFRSKLNVIEGQFSNFSDLFLCRLQQNMTQQNGRVCLGNF